MKTANQSKARSITLLACNIFAATLIVLVAGCATTKQTEDLLSAAGFKPRPAATAKQEAQLKSLPAHTVSSVQKNGKTYFVYPDVARNVLYIGQPAEYEQYKKLREQQKWAEEQVNPAEQMQVDSWVDGF